MRHYDCNVADVERGCGDAEYAVDGLWRSDSDEVKACAEGDDEPDGIDRRLRERVHFAPKA